VKAMRKVILLYLLLLLWFPNLFGQTKSNFYDQKRRLIADTNYKISKAQIKKIIPIEQYLIKHVQDYIDYPEEARETNDTGYVIASFKINATDTLQQITVEKAYEKKHYLSNAVKKALKRFPIPKSAYSKRLVKKKYFLAISFQLIGKNYKHPGFIEIKRCYIPLIEEQTINNF
jgi:hypothetical protein